MLPSGLFEGGVDLLSRSLPRQTHLRGDDRELLGGYMLGYV
jgi:hypothetical protein